MTRAAHGSCRNCRASRRTQWWVVLVACTCISFFGVVVLQLLLPQLQGRQADAVVGGAGGVHVC